MQIATVLNLCVLLQYCPAVAAAAAAAPTASILESASLVLEFLMCWMIYYDFTHNSTQVELLLQELLSSISDQQSTIFSGNDSKSFISYK